MAGAPTIDQRPENGAFRSIVDADPDLAAGIPEDERVLARRALMAAIRTVDGPFEPEAGRANGASLGALVIAGAVVRELGIADRRCTEILGPGDVIASVPASGGLAAPVRWSALETTTLMDLDRRFVRAAQRWPWLSVNLHRRLLEQAHRSAVHAAIAQLPRVERRVLALFWQLAERWGHVTADGVELHLPLTHEALGRLIGAQRPTVTLALTELTHDGSIARTPSGAWVLARPRPDLRAAAASG